MSDAKLNCATAYLRTNRFHERELLLTGKSLRRAFPDWTNIKDNGEVRNLLVPGKDRPQVKRQLRLNKKFEWVYRFKVENGDEDAA